jgi:hypothetical protein
MRPIDIINAPVPDDTGWSEGYAAITRELEFDAVHEEGRDTLLLHGRRRSAEGRGDDAPVA